MTDDELEPAAMTVRDGENLLLIGREDRFDSTPMLWNDGDIEWAEEHEKVEEQLFTAEQLVSRLDRLEDERKEEFSDSLKECSDCNPRKQEMCDHHKGRVMERKKVLERLRNGLTDKEGIGDG